MARRHETDAPQHARNPQRDRAAGGLSSSSPGGWCCNGQRYVRPRAAAFSVPIRHPEVLIASLVMGTLRQEILNSQQTRSDLLKWKLGLIGAIGAIGLGLAGSRVSNNADLVLCAVPLVCVYVDFLCRHLSLRILVIGRFFETEGKKGKLIEPTGGIRVTEAEQAEFSVLSSYEGFVAQARNMNEQKGESRWKGLWRMWKVGSAFALEDWAVTGSTLVVGIALLIYGAFVLGGKSPHHVPVGWAFVASGVLGATTTVVGRFLYRSRAKAVGTLEAAA
jgi:hypothetical protein